jgi:hypothetical protein
MAIGAVTARIITQYSDKGSKAAARDINKLGKNFDKFAGKVGKAFGLAAAASAAFAVKIGVDSVKAAIADEKSQALLANSLKNTTGATDAAIAATEVWIDQTQRAFGVVDDQLRPALSKLASVTGSVTDAQKLLGLALDVSAGGNVDLDAATNAVTKALQGNYKALKNLGVPITDAMVKSKDLNAILQLTAKTFGGAAATRANTFEFRMIRLGIALDEAKETLGTALLPVIEELFTTLTTKVIPAIQEWLAENGDKLVAAMTAAIKAVIGFSFVIFKTFAFVAKHKEIFVTLGAIFAATFVAGKVIAFVTAIQGLVKAYQAIRAAAIGAAAAQAAATGGISVAAAAAGVAAFAATLGGLYLVTKKANSEMSKMEGTGEDLEFSFDGLNGTTENFNKSLAGLNIDLGKAGKNTKALTAADLKLIATQKALAALAKFKVKPTNETDPIQLEAARLNLVKQANIQEAARVQAILANLEAQLKANDAIKRYTDLLGVVADSKISPEEVIILSQKWGISKDAVVAYTTAIFAVNDGKISTKEVDTLAAQWGVTKTQAQIYLDFFAALNDGKLSDEEINKLATKWGLTNKEVADYAKKIADGVTPSTLWPTPGNQAAQSWKDALAALNAYVAASGAKIEAPTTPAPVAGTPLPPGFKPEVVLPVNPLKPGDKGFIGPVLPKPATPSALESFRVAESAAKTPVPTPAPTSNFTSQGLQNKLKAMGMVALADGGVVNSPTAALIGEAGPEAVIPLNRMGSMGGSTVNIVVNGSVTSEGDLVNAIRNAILQGQNNGQAITKTAIQL